ncbi:MAG: PEP-utilizing enzyme, partial [Nitrospira sp.]|nr:PEP-utilizing enzyme [Nitrospira sp.]
GLFVSREDIFYLTLKERAALLAGESRDWKGLIQVRRAERDRWASVSVPDTIRDWREAMRGATSATPLDSCRILRGIPISAGQAEGPVRVVRSMEAWSGVLRGDILVVSVIDPGMAPLFGVAAGLIAEMGGTLSHGAIIAREFGLPTIANVPGAAGRLKDGDRVSLDAERGEIIIHERRSPESRDLDLSS